MSGRQQLATNEDIVSKSIAINKVCNSNINENHEIKTSEMNTDLHMLRKIRKAHLNKPMIDFLNINSLRNKIHEVREDFGDLLLDYFVLAETKINDEFPNSQFIIENYEIRKRRDRTKNGGGLIEFVRKGLTHKPMKAFPTKSESIFSGITIKNIKWLIVSIYRPPKDSNIKTFFEEMSVSLDKALQKYEKLTVMGDFNIDLDKPDSLNCPLLNEFCDMFDLSNMINNKTCNTKNHSSKIDLIFSNKPSSFQSSTTTETGLSDCHKLITTCMKATVSRIKPKVIRYRNYKNFDEINFLCDIKESFDFENESAIASKSYGNFSNRFEEIVNSHAPLKSKTIRGNSVFFMNKE